MLSTKSLTRRFGGLTAVNSVSFEVQRGEIRAIIGPNGAGKTTFFNLVTGAIPSSSGQILFKGKDMTGSTPQTFFHSGIVRTFQITSLFPRLSVYQNVELMALGRARRTALPFSPLKSSRSEIADKIAASLDRVGLVERADVEAGTLSHGDRRLVEIAMALTADPEILLLDEPTAGMSADETLRTAQLLKTLAPAVTVVIVEHDMSVVMSVSDRITVLHRGEILAEGTPAEISKSRDVQAVYFGEQRPA